MDEWILMTIRTHGGVLRRRDLVAQRSANLPAVKRALAELVWSGRLRRVRRGLYALPVAERDVIAARAAGGVLTCASAAAMLGLPLRDRPRAPHIALPQNRGSLRLPPPPGTVIHRDQHIVSGSDPRSIPLPLAIAHATHCLPLPESVALMDGALNRKLVRLEDLRTYRPAVGVVDFERAVRLADGSAQSFPETLARLALRTAGLSFETQAYVPGVGHVDFLVEGLVTVEIDGRAYHSDSAQFREDRRRDREVLARGLLPLRFTADEVIASTLELETTVAATVTRARALARAHRHLAAQRARAS